MYIVGFIELTGVHGMKRKDIKRRPLSDTVLANLEPESKQYRELDGEGLYFRVKLGYSVIRNLMANGHG